MRLNELKKLVQETISKEQRKKPTRRTRKQHLKRIVENTNRRILKEEDKLADAGSIMNAAGSPPITLVVLYGPPAAGKGAAKGLVGTFAGIAEDPGENFEDYLKALGDGKDAQMQEEDNWMVTTTAKLSELVFKEVLARLDAAPKEKTLEINYESIIGEYFHINESGKRFELRKLIPVGFIDRLKKKMKSNEEIVNYLIEQPKVKDFFTQARGFSKKIEGAPEELNACLGVGEDKKTLGVRLASQGRFMDDVKSEISAMFGDVEKVKKGKYAHVYLVDQAGESTTTEDEQRIKQLGELKAEYPEGGLTIIGIYVDQPEKRTAIANLHRASFGGRRVAQTEVDRIYKSAPTIENGKVTENGPVLDAMLDANFDQIHVFTPPNPVTDDLQAPNAKGENVPVANAICEPFGTGKGSLDIEGCDDKDLGGATSVTNISSFDDLENSAMDQAKIKGDTFPSEDEMDEDTAKGLAGALIDIGFSDVTPEIVKQYTQAIMPKQKRKGGKHGKAPWSTPLFGDEFLKDKATVKGRSPTDQITLKQESIDLARWNKLAGLLKD